MGRMQAMEENHGARCRESPSKMGSLETRIGFFGYVDMFYKNVNTMTILKEKNPEKSIGYYPGPLQYMDS